MSSGAIRSGTLLGGRYRLKHSIGAGGMATVWLAADERLSRPVAVKVLSDSLAADEGYRARFEREARVAASLSHPNLVNVFDYGSEDERPYLVMEYVDGPTLSAVLGGNGGPRVDGRELARGLLRALGAIHAAGIVHRDVKPSNILIGDDGRFRLTDFGIARPADAPHLTETGYVIGTLRYMAPEVREGAAATARSDLYACGVVISECLGSRPPGDLLALVRELTREDPARRPASAATALALLEGAPAASHYRALTPARALVALALGGLAAVALVLLLGGGGDGSHQGSRAATPDRATDAQSTITTTSTETSTATTTPAAAPGTTTGAATSCEALEAQKHDLEERQHAVEEQLKEHKAAKDRAHEGFEERKHALDEQIKACKEGEKP